MNPEIIDSSTLGEARDWMRDHASKGDRCPCCRQFVKVYRRKLNSGMAAWLIRFHRATDSDRQYHDAIRTVARGAGDWSLLSHWGLVGPHPDKPGFWRETLLGVRFVHRITSVRSHAVLYDGHLLRLDGDPVEIEWCLGNRFNYDELMGERPRSEEPE